MQAHAGFRPEQEKRDGPPGGGYQVHHFKKKYWAVCPLRIPIAFGTGVGALPGVGSHDCRLLLYCDTL